MTRPSEPERISTLATAQRLQALLRPDVTWVPSPDGFMDALPGVTVPPPGRAQAAWQTSLGASLYQRVQRVVAALLAPGYATIAAQLQLRPGQTVVDVGCGPGNVTNRLADAVGPHGMAVGVDLSAPMLALAARQSRPNIGLLRADATRLPLRDHSVDSACATAVIMLVPEPVDALTEMIRVVAPGGWLLVMVPCRPDGPAAAVTGPLTDLLGHFGGARMFNPDDLAILLEKLGCARIYSRQQYNMLTVRARAPIATRDRKSTSP
ncbi:class I SAM-dependent methyltransferase [Rhodococcus sp. NPDC127528]|uniref:class I SAM-dependent methyltransferase n=1 Tax=unclassified Rhodococcus (in: high G+C Gram-positive bacteria) TaxID=192944 RepID=UPI00362B25A2